LARLLNSTQLLAKAQRPGLSAIVRALADTDRLALSARKDSRVPVQVSSSAAACTLRVTVNVVPVRELPAFVSAHRPIQKS
jgi:hypothetical protein